MTGTLGDFIASNLTIIAHCETCRHSARIDLKAMAKRFGKDAMVKGSIDWGPARIAGRALTCKECRAINTSIRILPSTPSGPYLPR